ncbi:hypothetical protein OKW43_001381 [Paraburkholderia sp. WC7.3g]|uniref:hypothetical protein n=1 Tax=Paraburkholderia sp. WC7.3g TaxID=2991070 RepID=UPI003D1B2015
MYERMRSAKEIIEEMKARFADMFEGSDSRECLDCRITFKIYKAWPDMPQAMTINQESGERIPINAIRALPSGYDMRQALGQGEGCRCRTRPAGLFDEEFTLRDANGSPLADTYYTIEWRGFLTRGVTDSIGRTQRHKTDGAQAVRIYFGHRESV